MIVLVLLLVSLAAAQDIHYAPKLRNPGTADTRVKIDVVPMQDCAQLTKPWFCTDRTLEELQNTATVVCKSAEGMYSGGVAVELEDTNKNLGIDFDCKGNENSLDQCTVIELDRCRQYVIVKCEEMVDPDLGVNSGSGFGECAAGCGCMATALNTNIIGGTDAGMGEFPWQVTITDGKYICGGSIIDSWHILTAAHCMHSPKHSRNPCEAKKGNSDIRKIKICSWLLDGIRIYYDTIDFYNVATASHKVAHAAEIHVHSGYIRGKYVLRHDIAVIKLTEELSFNNYVMPVCLPDTRPWDREETDYVVASGFGTTTPDRTEFPETLQRVDLRYVPLPECNSGMYGLMKEEHLCTDGEGDRDSCRGDSGGPLIVKDEDDISTQIGVVSFSYGCAVDGRYSVYTDLAKEMGFVRSVLDGDSVGRGTVILTCGLNQEGASECQRTQ